MKIATNDALQQVPMNAEEQPVAGESDKQIISDGGCLYPKPGKDFVDQSGGKSYGFVHSGEVIKTPDKATTGQGANEMEKQVRAGRLTEPTCNGMFDRGIRSTPQRVGVVHTQGASVPENTVDGSSNKTAIDKSTGLSEPNRRLLEKGGCLLPVGLDFGPKASQDGANSGQQTGTVGTSTAVPGQAVAAAGGATLFSMIPVAATDPFHSVKILQNEKLWQQMIEQRLRELVDFGRRVPRWNLKTTRMLNGMQNFLNHAEQIANKLAEAENNLQQLLKPGQKVDVKKVDQLRRLVQLYGASLDRVAADVLRQTGQYSAEHARTARGAARAARAALNGGRSAQQGLDAFRTAEKVRAAGIAAGEAELAAGAASEAQLAARAAKLRIALRALGGLVLWTAATEAAIWGSEAMKEAAKINLSAAERDYAQSVINQALLDKLVQPFEIEQMSYPEALVYISVLRQALVDSEIQQKNAAQNVQTPQQQEEEVEVEDDEKK